ncbi:GerMN domain-containing protein [Pseudobutyrivibrio sp.]|uniref:GerMN domain-containing protein n=1 Tax=Pseudobutyrivibrio sp. TaxID=2014367 RepID=UPI001DAD8E31|nr:GerMN domain-containing protein [Pseudobutyrivibrio sp.]MBE5911907.1 sporulation and spore germination [Pseudobutyrivibrio sp.]
MKKILSFALILILALSTVACGKKGEDDSAKIYYVNTDKDGVTAVDYEYKAEDTNGQITEALNMLAADTDSFDYMSTIPAGVNVEHWELDDTSFSLYLEGDYEALDPITEILVRAGIVKTLTQIDGVDSISLYVNNAPFADSNGEAVGAMTADTFIDDFGQETDALLSTNLTLYFSSADGMSLVSETRNVYYSRNVALEKVVMEQLLKGPDSSELLSTLPTGTKVNSISVSDNGVCIINFDGTLETAITGVTENVTLYSIVNSLTELDSIKQVQILVNGEAPHLSNLEVDLTSPIDRNEDIINSNVIDDDDIYLEDYSEDYSDEYSDEYIDDETIPEDEISTNE